MGIQQRYLATRKKLDQVCRKAGRKPESVTLVAVSKTVGPDAVESALEAGVLDFGENRPDQLMQKQALFDQAHWHFIGNIQSRRIKDIVGRACLVHSLFEERHARKIQECAERLGIVQDVLLEVNVSGEQSKSGLAPDEVKAMLSACADMPNLRVCGLMTMAPRGNGEIARATFADLAALKEKLAAQMTSDRARHFKELSMGMSEDWREAVEEGATIVRVGRAIFSDTF